MARPSISYSEADLKNAKRIMDIEASKLNAQAAKVDYEQAEEATSKSKKLKPTKDATNEPEEEIVTGAEEKAEDVESVSDEKETPALEKEDEKSINETPADVIATVPDGRGGEIPIDNTINDPFANLDMDALKTEPIKKVMPKNTKTIKENNKDAVEIDDEVIMTSTPTVRESEVHKEIVETDSSESNEVFVQKENSATEKNQNSLVSENGTEKAFEEINEKNIPDVFDGIDTAGSLADIEVVENSNLIDISDSTIKIFDKPVFQVTALKSGYVAYMSALNFKDRDVFNRSDVDRVTHNRNLYRIIYDKMDHCSFGKPSFSDFMKITAWEDINTLLFGIYRQTFPGTSDILLTCNHCGKESRVSIDPNNFIVTKSEEATEEIQSLIRELTADPNMKAINLVKYSQISKIKRVQLPHSKIVIDICNPSLEKFNAISAFFTKNSEEAENMQTLISSVIFIDKIYVPNVRLSKAKGKLVFDRIENLSDILKILGKIDTEDEFKLKAKVLVRQDKYSVDYKVRNVVCPACNKIIGDIDADIENLLFLAIAAAVAYRTLPSKPKE